MTETAAPEHFPLPEHKTKIVATIGPASDSAECLQALIGAGMSVARLNFSHGKFDHHADAIQRIRAAEQATGRRVAIMADLPGPKMRIGQLLDEPIELRPGDPFVLSVEDGPPAENRASVTFDRLAEAVRPGNRLFLNDGIIQLEVVLVTGPDVLCQVVVGGELRSRKGLNLPGIDLGISAFTDHDRACLEFALAHGVDAVSQSFVENAEDIHALREAARGMGRKPFVIAKIERAGALKCREEILDAADGIMIARGDLGVEVPLERIAVLQKELIRRANLKGKPVITATQMLESMVENRLPTRAEATDVANAVLDGTDCVMLSAESAMGRYPVEAVRMLARIAAATEAERSHLPVAAQFKREGLDGRLDRRDAVSLMVDDLLRHSSPAAILAPTESGTTPRMISRFKLPVWIFAACSNAATCRALHFSYGVHSVQVDEPDNWNGYARELVGRHGLEGDSVILVAGPSARHPDANHRVESIRLGE